MDADWDDLRFFLAAWETRSFSRAAETLRVGQATVSRRIAALEERVGHPLFERTQAGLIPTPAGELLQPYAESMGNAAQQASAVVQGFEVAPEGLVRLAVPSGIAAEVLPRYLPKLLRRHPKLRLELTSNPSAGDVARHDVDIAITTVAPETGDVLVRRLAEVRFGIFAAPSYLRTLPARPKLDDLEFVGWSGELEGIAPAMWLRARVARPPIVSTDNTLTLSAIARRGLGAIVFPELLAKLAGFVPVPVKADDLPSITFFLVVHRAVRQVPRIAAVVDFLVELVDEIAREK